MRTPRSWWITRAVVCTTVASLVFGLAGPIFVFRVSEAHAQCEPDSIDINSASTEELEELTGIGEVLAQRIIDGRPYSSLDDLLEIDGIGESTLQSIKDQGCAYVGESEEEEGEGSISGHKWYDADGDGVWDDEEPPLEDWTIYLLVGGDVEKSTETDDEGFYSFEELADDDYTVCEELPEGWTQTFPTDGSDCGSNGYAPFGHDVAIDGENSVEEQNFGNQALLGSIHARKFNDLDGDGEMDGGEDPIEAWEICLGPEEAADSFLDQLRDFFFDDFEDECQETDEDGWVWWMDLPAGFYEVEEEEEDGWIPTTDTEAEVELEPGEEEEVFFGNQRPTIRAFKFWDKDGDGEWGEEEPPIEDWELCLSRILSNGEENGLELEEISCKDTDGDGLVVWPDLEDGEYLVEEEVQDGWIPTTDTEITVEIEESSETVYFGNTQNAIHVFKFWDKNGNGEQDEDEEGLGGWQFCLYRIIVFGEEGHDESSELIDCQETDEDGWVWWMPPDFELEEGTYLIEEEVKAGWVPTNTEDGTETVELELGEVTVEFGNDSSAVHARKFYDSFQNGELDEDDGGVRGWEICLYRVLSDGEENGELLDLVSCQETDEDGWVWWMSPDFELEEGDHFIEEEMREGWSTTTDNSEHFFLENGDEEEFLFGNWIDDEEPPVSEFDDEKQHEVLSEDGGSAELTGSSTDDASGVRSAELAIAQIGDEGDVENYPAQSFFDVFHQIDCRSQDHEPIETEIVSLSLTSTSPLSVTWGHTWSPSEGGIYCFEVRAEDNAGNTEETAFAGPIAYVPLPVISEESDTTSDTTSFTATWTTSHPATSRVIYDTVSHSELGEAPNYGYANSTSETDTDPMVTEHSVTVSGLTPGATYFWRSVSRGSPEQVGSEQSVALGGGGGGGSGGSSSSSSRGETEGGGGTQQGAPPGLFTAITPPGAPGVPGTGEEAPPVGPLAQGEPTGEEPAEETEASTPEEGETGPPEQEEGGFLAAVVGLFSGRSLWVVILIAALLLVWWVLTARYSRRRGI